MVPPATPPFELFSHPTNGLSLRTTCTLPSGTLLLSEPPLLHLPRVLTAPAESSTALGRDVLRSVLQELGTEEKWSFLRLSNCFKGEELDPLLGTFLTNALTTSETHCGIFPLTAVRRPLIVTQLTLLLQRINHSCTPNTSYHFSANLLHLHTLGPLPTGTELSISYLSPLLPLSTRLSLLQTHYRFTCSCTACLTPASEERRARIAGLSEVLREWEKGEVRAGEVVREAGKVLGVGGVVDREGLVSEKGRLWRDASEVMAAHSSCVLCSFGEWRGADERRITLTRECAKRAAEAFEIILGEKSEEAAKMRRVEKDPRKAGRWGTRGRGELDGVVLVDPGKGEGKKKRKKKKTKKAKKEGEVASEEQNEAGAAGE